MYLLYYYAMVNKRIFITLPEAHVCKQLAQVALDSAAAEIWTCDLLIVVGEWHYLLPFYLFITSSAVGGHTYLRYIAQYGWMQLRMEREREREFILIRYVGLIRRVLDLKNEGGSMRMCKESQSRTRTIVIFECVLNTEFNLRSADASSEQWSDEWWHGSLVLSGRNVNYPPTAMLDFEECVYMPVPIKRNKLLKTGRTPFRHRNTSSFPLRVHKRTLYSFSYISSKDVLILYDFSGKLFS